MFSLDLQEWGSPLQKVLRAQPIPQGSEVLIKLKYCGVCHSDVHIRDGYFELGSGKRFQMQERGMKLPMTMGHEPYGTVITAGEDANDVPVGEGGVALHDERGKPVRLVGERPGGYASYLLVPDVKYLIDAGGIDPIFASVLACSGLTAYSAIKKLQPCSLTDHIVIFGGGGLGLMAIAILKALGHERIILAEIDEKKWALAREAGATVLINPQRKDAIEQLKNVTGGLWGAIDFVGATQTAEVALQSLRKGGRLISVGLFGGEIKMPTVTLAQRALTIQGSYVGSLPELREVVELAKTGRLQPLPLSTCSADEISGVLDQLKLGQVHGRVVARLD
ncbi:MAG: hypothetical protein RIR83_1683 [Pseudomonadota bacterium]